ncbi:hypothetical protein KKG83_03010 [Candidatus Micrarchaeota archaeon]|nr:hypothetical protein [Candidatus Micrarchaeota archaeon]MBU2476414.1 hypothetical protein [Candidatus Micrarchaeota archaeon]
MERLKEKFKKKENKDDIMEPDYLQKLKKQVEKGMDVKGYGTFILIILMIGFFFNLGLGNPVGNALEGKTGTQEKTCEQINGICSENSCIEGYAEKENYCPKSLYCCKKA